MDSDKWVKREQRYKKKFEAGQKYIPTMFSGILPQDVTLRQIALLVFAPKASERRLAEGQIVHVSTFLKQIVKHFSMSKMVKRQVPEQFSLLRTLQFVAEYRRDLFGANGTITREGV